MRIFLALDTETHSIRNARMAQLGAVMADRNFDEVGSVSLRVAPSGWVMEEAATAVNGITQERAVRFGLPAKAVLLALVEMVKLCPYLIVYNHTFDGGVIRREIAALGSEDPGLDRPGVRVIDVIKMGATLQEDGRYTKLLTLHKQLLGWDYPGAHDGLADARAALRCARKMLERHLWEL